MSTRKERSDSKLGRLSAEQRAQLREWMLEGGLSYAETRELVKKEFGVSVGQDALHHFFQRVCLPVRQSRLQESASAAIKMTEGMDVHAFDAATIAGVRQMAFEAMSKGADADTVSTLMKLLLEMRGQELKRAQLDLQRDRFERDFTKAAMEHAESIRTIKADRNLDGDEKVAQIRKLLFGVTAEAKE